MSTTSIYAMKTMFALNCIIGLITANAIPTLAATNLSDLSNSSYLPKNAVIAQTPQVFCDVINIKTGQLALRFTPGGKARAGLNDGNVVKWLKASNSPWVYVRVIQGPNRRINGLTGWVNSDYLSCYDDG